MIQSSKTTPPYTLTKPQQADIAVDKVVDNLTPQVGENVTFTIDVTNNGPSTALAVEVADQLPAELTFVDSSRNDPLLPNYYNPATGVWTVGDMPNGASQTLTDYCDGIGSFIVHRSELNHFKYCHGFNNYNRSKYR